MQEKTPESADASVKNETRNRALVLHFYNDLVNGHNANLVDSFFTASFIDHDESSDPITSDSLKKGFEMFFAAFPDVRLEPHFLLADGDTVMARVTMKGTNTGPMMGMPATNKAIDIDGAVIFVIKDGRIAERWRYFDDMKRMEQLGMLPGAHGDTAASGK
jgi:steroid delta-isomerase-like uncharacterized protein